SPEEEPRKPYILILGVAQDGGYPQAGTRGGTANRAWAHQKHAACLSVVDQAKQQRWMFDVTPDFKIQLHNLDKWSFVPKGTPNGQPGITGIFLTHAHEGHYTGLINFSRPMMNTQNIPVYVLPRMKHFLESNAPWSLMIEHGNLSLQPLCSGVPVAINGRGNDAQMSVTPLVVPHRGELSETAGFLIHGPSRSVLYIPDVDSWDGMESLAGEKIEDLIQKVDAAFLDATFFDAGELPGRDWRDVPHPTVSASMERFSRLKPEDRSKIFFIHLNHTNKLLWDASAVQKVKQSGFNVAEEGQKFYL
ncbi:unnamed protein product, partial [Heterosigma akashiwo]